MPKPRKLPPLRLKADYPMRGVPVWIGLGAVIAAGCALAFYWMEPRVTEQPIHVTPHMLAELRALKGALTFGPTADGMYTGVHDPAARADADAAFGGLIDNLVQELPLHPSKKFLLYALKRTLSSLDLWDTEDRERATGYCEKIMDVTGVKSSDGVLSRWLYGPILGALVIRDMKAKQKKP